MSDLTLSAVLTVAGAGVVTSILVQAILAALALPAGSRDRFGPIAALAMGVIVVELASWGLGMTARLDIVQAALTGLLAGATAMGFYDTAGATIGFTRAMTH